MILVDTSVWVNHSRKSDPLLSNLLQHRQVLVHSLITGELAMGSPRSRTPFIRFLQKLAQSVRLDDHEVIDFVSVNQLFGRGLSFVDAHLLATVSRTENTKLWTHDLRLAAAAAELHLAFDPLN